MLLVKLDYKKTVGFSLLTSFLSLWGSDLRKVSCNATRSVIENPIWQRIHFPVYIKAYDRIVSDHMNNLESTMFLPWKSHVKALGNGSCSIWYSSLYWFLSWWHFRSKTDFESGIPKYNICICDPQKLLVNKYLSIQAAMLGIMFSIAIGN